MKIRHTILATLLLALGAQAEPLKVNFGVASELAAHYGSVDVSGNTTQDSNTAAPLISINGLDLDGVGANDDHIEILFAVTSSSEKTERLAAGYRLDTGTTLTFGITSAKMILGTGESEAIKGRVVSAERNNKGATVEEKQTDEAYLLKNTSTGNNRARMIAAEFEVPVDASRLAAPVSHLPASMKNNETPSVASKPAKTEVPRVIETDSLKLPRLFCDDMILQQQIQNTFWGWAEPGEVVTVKASWGKEGSGTADAGGKWKLFLETPKHGTGHSLTIRGKTDSITIANVAIGEVWLCAGQSNMGWSMGNSFDAEKEANVNLPGFRIFKSAREHWHEPLEIQRDRLSQWKPCDPDSAAEASAVSYYFGKKLHEELDVPVGIILQAYAGTPIEGWMPWEIQKEDPRASAQKAEYDESAERQTKSGSVSREGALETWANELAEYNAHIDAGETMKNSINPWSPPIITKPANLGTQYPGHLFNAMINPVRPYGIRGAIWYQGERNAKNVPQAFHYRKQLTQLIQYYRETWHELSGGNVDKNFPFQFTQLPSWTVPQTNPVEALSAPWVVSREAMRLVTEDVTNTAMAVSIDTGDAVQLHPKNKKPIGLRHAYLALKQTYGKDFVDYGPRFQKQTVDGNRIVLAFDSIGSGLVSSKSGKLDAFAIAGEDQQWHWANAQIQGDTILVSSPKVAAPIAVRYAWAMNPSQRNLLYNKEGLPASPFRTDDWPLFEPGAEIVEVKKPAKSDEKPSADWERPVMTQ